MNTLGLIYFYGCALSALAGALAVVLSKNPIRGAMGLLLLILSIAGLFLALHAQFLAAIQLIVYAGAIVILFLFVIMLLGPSASTPSDGRGIVGRAIGGGVFGLAGLGAIALVVKASMAANRPLPMLQPEANFGGIDTFGSVLFTDAIVPFELSSALLMVAVVGAIAVAKGRQGVKSLTKAEREAANEAPPPELGHPAETSGVFSHEIHVKDVKESAS
jgi:NADH-quinone oxidoreductase subunit J